MSDGERLALAQLLSDIVADATSKNRVMIDILNEPDARGIKCVPGIGPHTWHRAGSCLVKARVRMACFAAYM